MEDIREGYPLLKAEEVIKNKQNLNFNDFRDKNVRFIELLDLAFMYNEWGKEYKPCTNKVFVGKRTVSARFNENGGHPHFYGNVMTLEVFYVY